jgi:hypothetical protein
MDLIFVSLTGNGGNVNFKMESRLLAHRKPGTFVPRVVERDGDERTWVTGDDFDDLPG